jgi:hypothetical protein
MVYPKPISEVERDSRDSTPDKLVSIRMPASALVPNAAVPDAPLICYARGDAFADLVERVRTHLTTRLLTHVAQQPMVGGRGHEARAGIDVDVSHFAVRIGAFVFGLRPAVAAGHADIKFTTPRPGRVAASWDVFLGDAKVGWFSVSVRGRDGRFRIALAWVEAVAADAEFSTPLTVLKFQRLNGNVQMGDNYNDHLAFLADGTKIWVAMSGLLSAVQEGDQEAYYRGRMGDIPSRAFPKFVAR